MSLSRRLLTPSLALLSLAAVIVPLSVPAPALASTAEGTGEYFAFTLPTSSFSSATIACPYVPGARSAVSDPLAELAMNIDEPGPTTPLVVSLQYQSVNGQEVFQRSLDIDNVTRQITEGGVPVSSFFDIFGPLPAPVSPFATFTSQTARTIQLILNAIGVILTTQPPVYITDQSTLVVVSTDGAPGKPDVTQAQADAFLTASGLEYGDPNAGKVTQTMPPSNAYDCHGFTFTKGDRWINDYECDGAGDTKGTQTVQKILDENGYSAIPAPQAQEGDIVVYRRDYDGCADAAAGTPKITHTGKVVLVKTDGTIIVESKWGRLAQYRHRIDVVPASYGTATVYRTTRTGSGGNKHTLAKGTPQHPVAIEPTSWGVIKSMYR